MSPVKSLRGLFVCVGVCGVIVVSLVCVVRSDSQDLYRVLGVSRSASQKEIKNAYKRQAKLWHPDKNRSPEAMDKLIEINRAYEVLSKADKRRDYDITGRVGDSPQQASHPRGQGFTFFQGGNMFRYQFPNGPTHRNDDIITQQFFNNVLPDSHRKPYLLNFYTDFCVLCTNVGNIWKVLHKDLSPLGVGLGSVHANLHPRVTQYCGVSHVPSIVGVVSGRVVRYYGQLHDKTTMNQFLEDILPPSIVNSVTETNMDTFLSKAILANRPRVILFSPRQHPSLLYKLTAFIHRKTVDFGFVSTHAHWASVGVLSRFDVLTGEKQLAVFKENYSPVKIIKGTLNQAVLQSSVEGLTLLLPRLSSQTVFNTVCPAAVTDRFCVVLTVTSPSAYNDSVTAAFRKMTSDRASRGDSFAYIDRTRQADFLASFQPSPIASRACPSGGSARPVLVLRRNSNQFVWFDQFCGEDGDMNSLDTFLSALKLKPSQMKRVTVMSQLHDEDAPGWLGHAWNKVILFFSNFYDFLDAIDSNLSTLLASLIFPIMMICMLLLFLGNPGQEDRGSQPRTDGRNGHHSSNSVPHSSHRQRRSSPSNRRSSPQPNQPQLHAMDRHAYNAFVRDSLRGQIALVILINTHHETESKDLLQTFWSIASRYTDYRLKLCYLCYQTHSKWLEDILSQCDEIDSDEIKLRTSGCLLGQVATIVALLGSRRQFCAFPEFVPLSHIQEGDKVMVTEMVGTSATQDVVGINNRGKLDTRFASQIVETSSESSVKTNPDVKQGQPQSQTVGSVLGSALGFTEDNDSETEAETIGPNDSGQEGHRTDSDVFYGNGTAAHTGTTKLTAIGDLPPRLKDEAGIVSGTPTVHKNGSTNKEKRLKHDSRVDQIRNKFEMWMERLADGSLKRCTVDSWPEWRT